MFVTTYSWIPVALCGFYVCATDAEVTETSGILISRLYFFIYIETTLGYAYNVVERPFKDLKLSNAFTRKNYFKRSATFAETARREKEK